MYPELLKEPLTIHSYGVMVACGFIAGLLVARWRAKKVGLSPAYVLDVGIAALLGGIFGARIFYFVQFGEPFFWDFFKLWEMGGFVFYGGLIGATITVFIVVRIKKKRLIPLLDVLAPSVALGLAVGRIGCFLNGCCYGAPVKPGAWYGVVFPDGALAYDPGAPHPIAPGTPVFPSQPLSSFNLVVIFIILSLYFKHRRRNGDVAALYLILYPIHRFIVEFFRCEPAVLSGLSIAQCISVPIFFVGLGTFIYLRTSTPPTTAKISKAKKQANPAKSPKGSRPRR